MPRGIEGIKVKFHIPSLKLHGSGVVEEDHGAVVHVKTDDSMMYIVRKQNVVKVDEC